MKKIKISIRLFVITIGLLLCIQLPVFAAKGKATGSNIRIRKTPSTTSEVIEVLAINEEVEILGEEGDWYKVTFKGVTGYASKQYISSNEKVTENNNQPQENNAQNNENNENNQNNNQPNEEQPVNNEQNSQENNNENTNNEQEQNNNQEQPIVNKVFKIAENAQVNILPVLTSETIGEVKKNQEVTLINNAGLWAYIQAENCNGWVRIDKLSTENVNVDSTNPVDNTQTNTDNIQNNVANTDNNQDNTINTDNNQQNNYTPKKMYVKSTSINVRSQSNTSSEIVTSITINTEVNVVGEENGWYKVDVNGKSGYIRKDLLSDKKTEVSSRGNSVDRNSAQNNSNNDNTTANNNQTTQTSNTGNNAGNSTGNSTNQNTSENTTTNDTGTSSVPTSSSGVTGNDIVAYAKQFLGCKYVYGAAGPNTFDCSGLTMYVYKHFGYSLSHSSKVQATQGKKVTGELQPGDILVFTNNGSTVGHVGIYIGNDKFIHASDSSTGVIISNLSDRWNKSKYLGARRIL